MDSTQRTLCLIKPDAYRHFPDILHHLAEGFKIVGLKMFQWTKDEAGIFYLEHKDKPFYDGLVEFMASGPIVAVVLEGQSAITQYRSFMGATNPKEAGKGTLRAMYGAEIPANAVHGSDSEASAEREISLLFRPEELL